MRREASILPELGEVRGGDAIRKGTWRSSGVNRRLLGASQAPAVQTPPGGLPGSQARAAEREGGLRVPAALAPGSHGSEGESGVRWG